MSSGNYSFFGDWFFGNINATPTGNGTSFYYAFTESKKVAKPGQEEDNWVRWLTFVQFDVTCESDEDGAPFLLVSALISETAFEFNESQVFSDIYNKEASVSVTLECNCIGSSSLFCAGDPSNVGSKGCHITGDVTIEWDNDGITVGGTNYSWVPTPGFDQIRIGDYWEEEGVFPSSGSVTLKRDNACDPGECDCNADISELTATIDGIGITLGTSSSGGAQEPGGSNYEYTATNPFFSRNFFSADDCDPGPPVIRQHFATIFCFENDWYVQIIVNCSSYSGDTCDSNNFQGLFQKEWTGRFRCGENGKPYGRPFDLEVTSESENATCALNIFDVEIDEE